MENNCWFLILQETVRVGETIQTRKETLMLTYGINLNIYWVEFNKAINFYLLFKKGRPHLCLFM